jgi:methylated-DNA-[protein]-cysteine S-methyltransferase
VTAHWWRQASPVGTLTVLAGSRGLRRIELGETAPEADAVEECDDEIASELDEYFAGRRHRFTIPVDLQPVASDFRRRILETLRREVRYGETVSYGELADMAGRPRASRAVGNTMHHNPAPIVIPCHRVIAAGGRIGGYGPSGVPAKRFLLSLEGVEFPG